MRRRTITLQYYNFYYNLYKPFLTTHVAGLSSSKHEFDEYMSIAREELLYVMKRFDSDSGAFKAYLRRRVWGKIQHWKQKESRHKAAFSSSFDNCSSVGENLDNKMIVEEMLECLDEEQRRVLSSYYLDSMTFREIEATTGIPVSTAYVLKSKALQKIRQVHNVEL